MMLLRMWSILQQLKTTLDQASEIRSWSNTNHNQTCKMRYNYWYSSCSVVVGWSSRKTTWWKVAKWVFPQQVCLPEWFLETGKSPRWSKNCIIIWYCSKSSYFLICFSSTSLRCIEEDLSPALQVLDMRLNHKSIKMSEKNERAQNYMIHDSPCTFFINKDLNNSSTWSCCSSSR